MDSDFLHILTVSLLHSCTFTFWFVWALRVSTMKDYPFLDVIQSKEKKKEKKKTGTDFLSFEDAAFPLISKNTQPALSVI